MTHQAYQQFLKARARPAPALGFEVDPATVNPELKEMTRAIVPSASRGEGYTMPGETVFDPFGGIMTVPYCALRMGRKAIGVELNSDYFADGVTYAEEAAAGRTGPTLFDLLEAEARGAAE